MESNQVHFDLASSKVIEARIIGATIDGRLSETLLLTNSNCFVLGYMVLLDKKGVRIISIVGVGYDTAKNWYELQHPKRSFHKMYKPSWES
jgi:hypothetical protein